MTVFGTALLITGPESLLASRIVTTRRLAAQKEQPEAEVNRIDASELAASMLSEVVGGSLFASHIIAIIDDIGATPAEVVDQLVATAVDPGPELCLILIHQGGNKGRGLIDKLKKAKVEIQTVEAIKAWKLPEFCQSEAKRHGVKLGQDAAEALVAAVGTKLEELAAAVAQLADDAADQPIDTNLIQRYFAGRAEVSAFTIADAALAGNTTLALERLRWALSTGTAPVLVTSAMASGFRGMGKYLDAQGSRMSPADLGRQLGIPPWKLKDYSRTSRNWQRTEVASAIKLIAIADGEVKGAAANADYALERMLLAVLKLRQH